MTSRATFSGNAAQLDQLIGKAAEAGQRVAQLNAQIDGINQRFEQMRGRLGQVWGTTRWQGPERQAAEQAMSQAQSFFGRVGGALSQTTTYMRGIPDPLGRLQQALRSFRARLR